MDPQREPEPDVDPTRSAPVALGEVPYSHALVVSNPISGRGLGSKAAHEVAEGLKQRGVPAELFLTDARGDAFTRLRSLEENIDLVVAVGGDGTLREVLEGLVDTETPVGILPFGTANVVATQLGLPRDVHHHVEILLRGKTARYDAARVNGNLSVLVTGVGFDAMAVKDVDERRSGPISKLSYVGAVLRTMRGYEPPRLSVEIDGKRLPKEYGLVLVSNTQHYGGILHMSAETLVDDGKFEVYLFPTAKLPELMGAFFRGVFKSLPGGAITMRQASHVRVESEHPVPYQVDGDLGGMTPVELEVLPNQYRLIVP